METTSRTATTSAGEFIEASRIFLKEDYLPKLLHVVERMTDDDLWWRPNEASNSAGNLILHLSGNVRQWIVAAIGGARFDRNRDLEFSERGPVSKAELISKIERAIADADGVIAALEHDSLLRTHTVQKYHVTALQSIYHVVEHFSYHLGQILYIYKLRTASDPEFYEGL
jgi:uncharacterized damage-inducible protein DinB